jgi:transcription elongation factor GreB
MTKAFKRESNDDGEPPVAAEIPAPIRNYISPAGYARLKAELKQLVEAERPEVVRTVSAARTATARERRLPLLHERLGEIDRRVRF